MGNLVINYGKFGNKLWEFGKKLWDFGYKLWEFGKNFCLVTNYGNLVINYGNLVRRLYFTYKKLPKNGKIGGFGGPETPPKKWVNFYCLIIFFGILAFL
jgi:hypothetical protein